MQPRRVVNLEDTYGSSGSMIDLYCGDACRVACQQSTRQPAGAWTHFNDVPPRQVTGLTNDLCAKVFVQQKMLAERLAGIEPVLGNHFA
jgi:hypothetical protein